MGSLGVITHKRTSVMVDGELRLLNRPVLNHNTIGKLNTAALSLPYEPTEEDIENGDDFIFEGMCNAEVMSIRLVRMAAQGANLGAIKELLDRTLGKPLQSVESKSLSLNYTDYLTMLAKEEEDAEDVIDL